MIVKTMLLLREMSIHLHIWQPCSPIASEAYTALLKLAARW